MGNKIIFFTKLYIILLLDAKIYYYLILIDVKTSSPKGNDAHLRALGSRYYACP